MLLVLLVSTVLSLHSQEQKVKASRQSSMEAFTAGDYEKALSGFGELLATYPKDPLYKYYSGVCMVKLNRDPAEAESMLKDAMQGGSVARIVPADALYWHARALQQSGRYQEAVEEFTTFTGQAGKKVARELDVSEYVQQCNNGKGELLMAASLKPEVTVKPGIKAMEEITPDKPAVETEKAVVAIPEEKLMPEAYDKLLTEGMALQRKADSAFKSTDPLKADIDKLGYREKSDLKAKIAATEALAESYQKQSDQKFSEAQAKMNDSPSVIIPSPVAKKDTVPVKKAEPARDSIRIIQNNIQQTLKVFEPDAKPGKENEKIVIDAAIPPGLVYRIQLAVFRNPVLLSYFKGLSPVNGFRVAGTDKTNYYAGIFRRSADAAKALTVVRQRGFRDAFVVSLADGKIVSADRAAMLEKEWGTKPFSVAAKTGLQMVADTLPPTLSFRVELQRSAKPVKTEVLDDMKRVAGNRGLDTEKLADGTLVYLAGKFITYESAEDYAALLSRNGYRDAKVTAWLGRKQIPVETARGLFENLE